MARRKGNPRFKKVRKRVKRKGAKSYVTTIYVLKKGKKRK